MRAYRFSGEISRFAALGLRSRITSEESLTNRALCYIKVDEQSNRKRFSVFLTRLNSENLLIHCELHFPSQLAITKRKDFSSRAKAKKKKKRNQREKYTVLKYFTKI